MCVCEAVCDIDIDQTICSILADFETQVLRQNYPVEFTCEPNYLSS